jgi:16S rRNA processing protein RimM
MQNMEKIVIGKIFAPHGVKGCVKIRSYSEPPALLLSLDVELENGTQVKLNKHSANKDILICAIEGVSDRNVAEKFVGQTLLCDRSALSALDEEEFYINDLINCTVIENNLEVGSVLSVQNFGAGDILEVKFAKNSEFYPFDKKHFPEIDIVARKIILVRTQC